MPAAEPSAAVEASPDVEAPTVASEAPPAATPTVEVVDARPTDVETPAADDVRSSGQASPEASAPVEEYATPSAQPAAVPAENPAPEAPPTTLPVGPPKGRPFRAPWWAGNRTATGPADEALADTPTQTAAAAVVETPDRQAPAGSGQTPVSTAATAAPPISPVTDESARPQSATRIDHWFAAHGTALLWVLPVMIAAAVVTAFGLAAPSRTVQEALYTGYVWDFVTAGRFAPFTAWAQHPPLGWMQMAAYVEVSGAFDRWDFAVVAVREAMVPFAAATAGAAWLLARRFGLSRPAATVAAAVLTISPFALAQHATVSLENVAAPWLLVAFVLATSRRVQPLAFAASAAAFAVAVMSAETAVIGLPFLAWVMIASTRRGARVWPIVSAAVTLQVIAGVYLVVASRDPAAIAPASPVFAAFADAPAAIATWWSADPVLLVLVVVGAAAGLAIPRLRPLAVLALVGVAVLAVPGIVTPDGFPALLLPFGVVTVVGATEECLRVIRAHGVQRSALPAALVAVVALAATVAVPLAITRLPAAFDGQADDALTRAERWMLDNVADGSPVLVDTTSRIDFLRAGWSRDEITAYDSTAGALPADWTDAQWAVVSTSRADETSADSVVVASFDGVDVRRVLPGQVAVAQEAEAARAALRASLGAQVAQNPDVELADADRDLLVAGEVDDRIVSVLGALTIFGRVDVAGFPVVAGEEDGPLRQVSLAAAGGQALVADGELTEAGRDVVAGLLDRYAPEQAAVRGGLLVLRYPITLGEAAD